MFKRPSIRYGKAALAETPYQRAAQLWDDRIGSARVQARSWRLMAFGCLVLCAGLSIGLVGQGARGSITPWVIEVDSLGQAQAVAPADADFTPSDPQIAFHLGRFIEQIRSLAADPIVVRDNWLRAYDFTTNSGAMALNELARLNDPFANVGRVQVSTEISSVIRASSDSFRIAWVERRYQDGSLAKTERWSAIVTITVQVPRDPERLKKNPLGLYVNNINWSKELSQ